VFDAGAVPPPTFLVVSPTEIDVARARRGG
jgi:hypothetical protein